MSTRLSVLVVDDDAATRAILEATVVALGHECRVARDGVIALRMHRADPADVILSDWQMPNMDGLELCQQTRLADAEQWYTHFIFLTGLADREHFQLGMAAGADDYQAKPIDLDERAARLASAARVVSVYRRLAAANRPLRRDSQTYFRLARCDALTGVANRLRLEEDLRVLWTHAERYGHRYSAVLCDIDWFKTYNDHSGHVQGDAALRTVAETIRAELREGDTLYRFGGEEFLTILPEQSETDALGVATRVCRAVERRGIATVAGAGVMTVSAGVAELDLQLDGSATAWLERADAGLYRAKANGRNRSAAAMDRRVRPLDLESRGGTLASPR